MDWLDLFPNSCRVGAIGQLEMDGHTLSSLAKRWGTPLYLYDGLTVRNQVENLKSLLKTNYPGESEIAYAAKAYFSLGMARQMSGLDIGVDVVSQGELLVALQANFPPSRIHLHGNNKSEEELVTAMKHKIQAVVVDSLDELSFLEKMAEQSGHKVRIWLRLTPGVDVDTHPKIRTAHHSSKFGIHVAGGEAAEAIQSARECRNLKLTGLHIHLGSQIFDPEPYVEAIKILLQLSDKLDYIPEEISAGGGWGVPYNQGMISVDPNQWIGNLCKEIIAYFGSKRERLPKLVLEPGRWLVAKSGVALYRIGTTKQASDGTYYISIDGGMADNPRPTLYQAKYTAVLADRPDSIPVRKVALVGKYCETGDQLIDEVLLPDVVRGDLVAVPVAGAYQLSMSSNYNLSARPAVLWLDAGDILILQQRETPELKGWWVDQVT